MPALAFVGLRLLEIFVDNFSEDCHLHGTVESSWLECAKLVVAVINDIEAKAKVFRILLFAFITLSPLERL